MKKILYFSAFLILFSIISCRKNELPIENLRDTHAVNGAKTSSSINTLQSTTLFENHDDDAIERITVLGNQLPNPYLIPNMQQAYQNLGIANVTVNITDLYVRFKPADVDELDVLITTMEAQGLEVFDTPVDYEVIYEGDYYQDPSVSDEDITWQYAVVPPTFQFPSGIMHQTLAQLHIPSDDSTAVETEAERLADIENEQYRVPYCGEGFHWDASLGGCVPDSSCPLGTHWDFQAQDCVPDVTIPAPATDASVPSGGILVFDTQTNTNRPVRKATVVARRWFKIERGFTNNNGYYQLTKRFKNNVRINIKFKNSDAEVRGLRGVRLWQMLFPIKKTLGIFSGNKNSINYTFGLYTDPGSKGNRYWAGATTHNAVQDYRDYAPQEGIGQPPTGIKILLTNLVSSGASPMWYKRGINVVPQEFLLTFVATAASPIAGGLTALAIVLKHQIDITISYQYPTSDALKETAYHELTHAAQYASLGNSWYSLFVEAEINALISTASDPDYSPYGRSTGADHDIIALGESWAYYMGHYFADKQYGVNYSGQVYEQSISYSNNYPIYGLSSHLNLLEDFSPYRTNDPFFWIPQGLFYDLKDNINDLSSGRINLNDQVGGYTNQQMFNAFNSNTSDLQSYRVNILQQNGNNQSTALINLFSQYGY